MADDVVIISISKQAPGNGFSELKFKILAALFSPILFQLELTQCM